MPINIAACIRGDGCVEDTWACIEPEGCLDHKEKRPQGQGRPGFLGDPRKGFSGQVQQKKGLTMMYLRHVLEVSAHWRTLRRLIIVRRSV